MNSDVAILSAAAVTVDNRKKEKKIYSRNWLSHDNLEIFFFFLLFCHPSHVTNQRQNKACFDVGGRKAENMQTPHRQA